MNHPEERVVGEVVRDLAEKMAAQMDEILDDERFIAEVLEGEDGEVRTIELSEKELAVLRFCLRQAIDTL